MQFGGPRSAPSSFAPIHNQYNPDCRHQDAQHLHPTQPLLEDQPAKQGDVDERHRRKVRKGNAKLIGYNPRVSEPAITQGIQGNIMGVKVWDGKRDKRWKYHMSRHEKSMYLDAERRDIEDEVKAWREGSFMNG